MSKVQPKKPDTSKPKTNTKAAPKTTAAAKTTAAKTSKTNSKAAPKKAADGKKSAAAKDADGKEKVEVDIGDSPNIATYKAKLNFNVNKFRDWMKDQFKIMTQAAPKLKVKLTTKKPKKDAEATTAEPAKEVEAEAETAQAEETATDKTKKVKKVKEVKDGDAPVVKLNGAHIALAAANEALCNYVLSQTVVHIPKEKAGLHTLGKASLIVSTQLDNDLKTFFFRQLEVYDADTNFSTQYCIPPEDLKAYVTKKFGDNVNLDGTGSNLLAYLLLKFSTQITRTAYELMVYSGRGMLEPNSVNTAVRIHCPDGMSNLLCMRIADAINNYGGLNKEDEASADETGATTTEAVGETGEDESEAAGEEQVEAAEDEAVEEPAEEVKKTVTKQGSKPQGK
jgi:hypothetical protein